MAQPASPDLALLQAGWERDAATDRYRKPGEDAWLTAAAARILAFGTPGESAEAAPVLEEQPIRVLLQRILEELQQLNRTLGGRLVL